MTALLSALIRWALGKLAARIGMELVRRGELVAARRQGRAEGRFEALAAMQKTVEDAVLADGHAPTLEEMSRLFEGEPGTVAP